MKFELIADTETPRGFRQIRPKREGMSLLAIQIPRSGANRPDGIEIPEGASGIYFLLDENHSRIYIGESYQVFTRYLQHPEIPWWTHAICFFIKGDNPITEKERNWLEKELHSCEFHMEVVSSGRHGIHDMSPVPEVLKLITCLSYFLGVHIERSDNVSTTVSGSALDAVTDVGSRPITAGQWAHEICSMFFDVSTEAKRQSIKRRFEGLVRQHITHYVQTSRGECKPGELWRDRYRSLGILGTDGRTIPIDSFPWPLTFVDNA